MKPWPVVTLASVLAVGLVVLAVAHVDTSVIVSVLVPVLGALIYGEVRQISGQTNGQTTKLLQMVQEMSAKLAESHPPMPPMDTTAPEVSDPPSTEDQP